MSEKRKHAVAVTAPSSEIPASVREPSRQHGGSDASCSSDERKRLRVTITKAEAVRVPSGIITATLCT